MNGGFYRSVDGLEVMDLMYIKQINDGLGKLVAYGGSHLDKNK